MSRGGPARFHAPGPAEPPINRSTLAPAAPGQGLEVFSMNVHLRRLDSFLLALGLALGAAACGSNAASPTAPGASAAPARATLPGTAPGLLPRPHTAPPTLPRPSPH